MTLAMRPKVRLNVFHPQRLILVSRRSRGHGRTQRMILERLTDRWSFSSARIIAVSFTPPGAPVSPATIEAVRRALRALERESLVCIYEPGASGTTKLWTLTEAQRKRAERERAREKARERKAKRDEEDYLKFSSIREMEPQPERDLLIKILGMLSSNHGGEVLSAARKAEELRAKLGLSWDQIVRMFLPGRLEPK